LELCDLPERKSPDLESVVYSILRATKYDITVTSAGEEGMKNSRWSRNTQNASDDVNGQAQQCILGHQSD